MKHVLVLAVLLFLSVVRGQSVYVEIGYTGMSLSNQKVDFQDVEKELSVKTNKLAGGNYFPANVYFAGVWDVYTKRNYTLSIELMNLRTDAHMRFGDETATLDIDGLFNTVLLGLRSEQMFPIANDLKYFFGVSAGIGRSYYEVNQKVIYYNSVYRSYNLNISDRNWMVYLDIHGRFEKKIAEQWWGGLEFGARAGAKSNFDFKNEVFGFLETSHSGSRYNISGFRIALTCRYYFTK